jgi:hypothetical protein
MKLPSASQTIKESIPLFVLWTIKNKGIFPTKGMIYKMIKTKFENEPHLFNGNDWRSAFGTTRSKISQVCKNEEGRSIKELHSFEYEGVDYFYTDKNQIYELALKNNSEESIEKTNKNETRKHVNIQYQLCSIFTKIGCDVWVPKNDSSGGRNKTKYDNKTIIESHETNLLNLTSKDTFYWVDFVAYQNGNPIVQVEVEESTEVLKGLERMNNTKKVFNKIKSIVTSTKPNYLKKFQDYTNGTYESLSAEFMDTEKIEKLFKKSQKVQLGDENFKNLVFKEFGI